MNIFLKRGDTFAHFVRLFYQREGGPIMVNGGRGMKVQEFVWSIVLYGFLGYLWTLFSDHIVSIANSMDNVLVVGGIILLAGTLLFWEIVKRIAPFNEYKNTHPIKLVGLASFIVVVVVNFV